MRVSTMMRRGARTVAPKATVADIARIMTELDVGVVPVVDDDRLVGMVTDRDLALRAIPKMEKGAALTAQDIMSPKAVFCHADDRIEEAIHRMEAHGIRRVPVLDGQDRVVGMLSMGDIVHCNGKASLTMQLLSAVSGHHPNHA